MRSLILRNCQLGDKWGEAFYEKIFTDGLRHIDITHNKMGAQGLELVQERVKNAGMTITRESPADDVKNCVHLEYDGKDFSNSRSQSSPTPSPTTTSTLPAASEGRFNDEDQVEQNFHKQKFRCQRRFLIA